MRGILVILILLAQTIAVSNAYTDVQATKERLAGQSARIQQLEAQVEFLLSAASTTDIRFGDAAKSNDDAQQNTSVGYPVCTQGNQAYCVTR